MPRDTPRIGRGARRAFRDAKPTLRRAKRTSGDAKPNLRDAKRSFRIARPNVGDVKRNPGNARPISGDARRMIRQAKRGARGDATRSELSPALSRERSARIRPALRWCPCAIGPHRVGTHFGSLKCRRSFRTQLHVFVPCRAFGGRHRTQPPTSRTRATRSSRPRG
jgi:hypothetical protein